MVCAEKMFALNLFLLSQHTREKLGSAQCSSASVPDCCV